jgi:hypothetical protein
MGLEEGENSDAGGKDEIATDCENGDNNSDIGFQRYWVFGLIHRPGIKKQTKEKHDVSETGSISVLR